MDVVPGVESPPRNPTQLSRSAFLMNIPFSYATKVANNPWMEEIEADKRDPDINQALIQFLNLYGFIASEAVVYLLPTPQDGELQDLTFTANLGVTLEHTPDRNTVVLSNFTSKPRRGETEVGRRFFGSMGYNVHVPETKFEGEADLKYLHDNVYVGGFGIRSQAETYDWMSKKFGMTVVKMAMTDPYLYHLDCTVFPVTREQTLVCTEMYDRSELSELGNYTDIIDVPSSAALSGVCNSMRLNNTILNASHIQHLKAGTEEYEEEASKNRLLEVMAAKLAFEVTYFNLSEYLKGGALLSCMIMHLNHHSYSFRLL
jgi:N-dimethylarginine dimethylaminohydrolase